MPPSARGRGRRHRRRWPCPRTWQTRRRLRDPTPALFLYAHTTTLNTCSRCLAVLAPVHALRASARARRTGRACDRSPPPRRAYAHRGRHRDRAVADFEPHRALAPRAPSTCGVRPASRDCLSCGRNARAPRALARTPERSFARARGLTSVAAASTLSLHSGGYDANPDLDCVRGNARVRSLSVRRHQRKLRPAPTPLTRAPARRPAGGQDDAQVQPDGANSYECRYSPVLPARVAVHDLLRRRHPRLRPGLPCACAS